MTSTMIRIVSDNIDVERIKKEFNTSTTECVSIGSIGVIDDQIEVMFRVHTSDFTEENLKVLMRSGVKKLLDISRNNKIGGKLK